MSPFEPNTQQERAITCIDRDVVVEAGAGSGKTTVLAHRFVYATKPPDDANHESIDIDDILTITFTRKAAAELTERVRRALLEQGVQGVAASRRVDEAWISTIDSLCSRIVRRHVFELGRDPDVRYASEVQAAQLMRDAARAAISSRTSSRGDGGVIEYGVGQLASSLVRDLENLRSMGSRPEDVLTTSSGVRRELVDAVSAECSELLSAFEQMGGPTSKTGERNLSRARRVLGACSSCDEIRDPSSALALLETLTESKLDARAKPQSAVVAAKARIEELAGALKDELLAPYARGYLELLKDYAGAYAEAKASAGVMDFGDAVEGAARLLTSRPDIAHGYREGFKLIMMDEFQDTNELQMQALAPIRNGNLCAVGDVQQSIYGFRHADVDVMRRLAEEVETELPLTMNYRSHPDVLSAINHMFAAESLMGSEYVPLLAERAREYVVPWPEGSPRVELHLLDETQCEAGSHAAEEAALIAGRVRELIDAGARADDIAILLRGMTHAPKIAQALSDQGVPAYLASGEAFFKTPEIRDMRALLRAVAVPDDDAAMVCVLAGPVGALTDSALLAVAATRPQGASLWAGVQLVSESGDDTDEDAVGQATWVREGVRGLRDLEGTVALTDLIHEAAHVFDYDLTLLASGARGPQAWANVGKLVRMADDFECTTTGDLCEFLDYLDDHEELLAREPVAPVAVAEGAVRIMSVHAAKGLEFPVVVVPNLGAALAGRVQGRTLLERDESGTPRLAMRWPQDGTALESLSDTTYEPLKASRKRAEVEEEKRILYVALTRAEEALVLVGRADPSKSADSACGLITEALDVGPDTETVDAGGASIRVAWHTPARVDDGRTAAETEPASSPAGPLGVEPVGVIDQDVVVSCLPGPPESLPRSLSYTSLHTFDQCPYRFYARYVLGLTTLSATEQPALEVGNAVHLALQTAEPLDRVEAIAASAGLDAQQRVRVGQAVESFLGCSIASRLDAAGDVRHEHPFAVPLDSTRLEGKIDAMACEPDRILMVDYKTGQDVESSGSAERMASYELQASCYALAALEDGAPLVEVVFVFVEQGCRSVGFEFGQEDRDAIRQGLLSRTGKMQSGEYPWLSKRDERLCGDCPAAGICPLSLS
jgi:ATP-dependent exoDNAse (exonuclease V) beta subunit